MRLQEAPTDQSTGQSHEGFMQLRATFIANAQATELMQPGERAFHDPAMDPQATAMRGETPGQHRPDMQMPQPDPMGMGVVGTVALQTLGTATGATPFASHRRDGLHQRLELGNIIPVCTGQTDCQGNPLGIRQEMVFAAWFGFVRGIPTGFCPPFRARTEALSITARDQSI